MFGVRNGSTTSSISRQQPPQQPPKQQQNGRTGRRSTVFNTLHSALLPVAEGLVSNLHRRRFATVPKDDVEHPPIQIYRPKSLMAMCEMTKFSKREIQIIYRSFKQGCPTGIVTLTQFQEILSQFFPRGNPKRYAEYVFKTFDRDGNDQINFEEFVTGLSIITRGTIEDKIDWIFRLYDVNKRGIIGQPELLMVTQAIYEILGKNVEPPINRRGIINHVLDVHKKMCKNGESFIDRETFIQMCRDDIQLCDSLVLFDTIL